MSADDASAGGDVEQLLRRLAAAPRDPQAWQDFFVRLWPYVLALTHRHLGEVPRRLLDAEDVAQEVFLQFARFWHSGKGVRPTCEGPLRALLTTMARHQCSNSRRLLLRERRDARRERPLTDALSLADLRPLAEAVAEYNELLERILGELTDDDRRLVRLLIAGESEVEIARRLGVADRTIRRRLAPIREAIRKHLLEFDLE